MNLVFFNTISRTELLKYVVDCAFQFLGPDWNQRVISDNSSLWSFDIRFGAGNSARNALQTNHSFGATSP